MNSENTGTNLYTAVDSSTDRMTGTAVDTTESVKTTVTALIGELEQKPTEFDVYEGQLSGAIYVEADGEGLLRAELTDTGLEAIPAPSIDEDLNPLAHIEPEPEEPVEDAVDSITFAGD